MKYRLPDFVRDYLKPSKLWHSGTVTCLAVDAFGTKLISGSADHSCCIWSIESDGTIKRNPVQTLFGHSKAIAGVAISTELDMAVSGMLLYVYRLVSIILYALEMYKT